MRALVEGMEIEGLLEILANKLPVGVYIVQEGKFCYVNPFFQRFTGYREGELLGKNSLELIVPEDRKTVTTNAMKMLRGELTLPYEFRVTHKNGNIKWLMESVVSVQHCERRATLGSCIDITNHKQAKATLSESKEKYKELVDSITDVFFEMNRNLKYTYWNKASEKLTGIPAEDALGKSLLEIFPDTPWVRSAEKVYRDVLQTQQSQTFVNNADLDGRHYIFEISAYPSRTGVSVFVKDITERRKVEDALRESEQRYSRLYHGVNEAVALYKLPDLKITHWNSHYEDLHKQMVTKDIGGATLFDVAPMVEPEDWDMIMEKVTKTLAGEGLPETDTFEIRMRDLERKGRVIEVKPSFYEEQGQVAGIQVAMSDITERKRAEEMVRQSERKYRTLVESIPQKIYHKGVDLVYISCNASYAKDIEITPIEIAGKTDYDFWPREMAEKYRADDRRVIESRQAESMEEKYVQRGAESMVHIFRAPVKDEDGNVIGVLGIFHDITERREMEERIRQAAEEWRSTFDSISDAISIHGKDYEIRRVNKAFADIFHTQPRELLGKHCYEVMHGTKGPVPTCPHQKALQTGKPARAEFFEPNLGIYLEATTSPILDERGEIVGTVHVTRDITERKQQNERLMMANRLASIGELAAGTAHELNNPLTSVIGFSQLLMERDIPDDVREDLQLIYNEAQRAANVTKNLLTFARKRTSVKQLNQINNIIEDVLKLRAYGRKVKGIVVKRQLAPDLPAIMVDYSQLQQVFINIIINAEYFMTEAHNKGTLTIATKKQNGKVRVSIADDGPGIPREHLSRLFDPFFTTKKTGKGTGLGLSICHGIVTEHGGQIYARSQPGKGATFFVELPINSVG